MNHYKWKSTKCILILLLVVCMVLAGVPDFQVSAEEPQHKIMFMTAGHGNVTQSGENSHKLQFQNGTVRVLVGNSVSGSDAADAMNFSGATYTNDETFTISTVSNGQVVWLEMSPDVGYRAVVRNGENAIPAEGNSNLYRIVDATMQNGQSVLNVYFELAGGSQPITNSYTVVLEDVADGGSLSADMGEVKYIVGSGEPTNLAEDCDGAENNVAVIPGNSGGSTPRLKYEYQVQTGNFVVRVTPAAGKKVVIMQDDHGQMTEKGSYTIAYDYPMSAGECIRVSFTDIGTVTPPSGGQKPPSDSAPAADDIRVQFNDNMGNSLYYGDVTGILNAKAEYSYDGIIWNELTNEQVEADNGLKFYCERIGNGLDVNQYYFTTQTVYFKVSVAAAVTGQGYFVSDMLNPQSKKVKNDEIYTLTSGTTYELTYDNNLTTLVWSSDAQRYHDGYIANGSIKVLNSQYSGNGLASADDLFYGGDFPYSGITQDGTEGHVGIQKGATVTVQIIPDYGYQLLTASINGCQLTPNKDNMYCYTFEINGPLQLAANLTKVEDEVNCAEATGVIGGTIANGENVIAGGVKGNLRLNVKDSAMTDAQKQSMSQNASNVQITNYLEVNLEQFVKQGSDKEWTAQIKELTQPVTISLNVGTGLNPNNTYVVVREHNGIYTELPATYHPENGTLTFQTDKFSNYAIGKVKDTINNSSESFTPAANLNNSKVSAGSVAVTDKEVIREPVEYVIGRGDTLSYIAYRNRISLSTLLTMNPQIKNPNRIYVGQKIIIGYTVSRGAEGEEDIRIADYIIQRGDTLARIARRNGMTLKEIAELNPELVKQRYIYPGQRVRVKYR